MIPEFLKKRLEKYYDEDTILDITNSYSNNRYSSLRINTIKCNKEEFIQFLKDNQIEYKEVKWSPYALIINNIEKVKESNFYKEGKIYLQSLSSQIPPIIVDPKKNEQILDMTAAPGGKTTELAALSNNQAMITATEKNKIRYDRLQYNIEKQGAKKVTILKEDARSLNEYFLFDKILLDAPCSGSGTLNMNEMNKISEDLINRSIQTQKELIKEAIKHLKTNGELIYSTCSILKEENEEIIKEVLNYMELIPIHMDNLETLPSLEGTITIKPNEFYEGFFVAKLRKIKTSD